MSFVSLAIGAVYESRVQDWFPEFHRTSIPNHPDFTNDTFYIEAKGGYRVSGIQLKRAQVRDFGTLARPTIYIIGFHGVGGLMKYRTRKSKERLVTLLQGLLQFPEQFAVSNTLIEKIWGDQGKVSTRSLDHCRVRPGMLNHIIEGRKVVRKGRSVPIYEHYGIDPDEYLFQKQQRADTVAVLLHREQDTQAIAFLRSKKKL